MKMKLLPYRTHSDFWILFVLSFISIADALVTIFSFGRFSTDWRAMYMFREEKVEGNMYVQTDLEDFDF
jgi:hypothetical protein